MSGLVRTSLRAPSLTIRGGSRVSESMITISFHTVLNFPGKTWYRTATRSSPYSASAAAAAAHDFLQQSDDHQNLVGTAVRCQQLPPHSNPLLTQANTVGILGGVSVFSTLIFLEKLVWWSSRNGDGECVPFVVCSDPTINRELVPRRDVDDLQMSNNNNNNNDSHGGVIVENLRGKREFLEQSGAGCIVMPCNLAHAWHSEVSEGCGLPFLHVGECVARELSAAKLRPLEVGSNVRIGLLATHQTLMAGFYRDKLESQGFEVVLPDMATMEHIVNPAMEALKRKDMEGARNLIRVAVNVLLVRAVNVVVLASDEMQDLLPRDDPLSKKCINPMDALARSTLRWAKSIQTPSITRKTHLLSSKLD